MCAWPVKCNRMMLWIIYRSKKDEHESCELFYHLLTLPGYQIFSKLKRYMFSGKKLTNFCTVFG